MTISNAGENNAEKLDQSYIACGNVEQYNHWGKQFIYQKLISSSYVPDMELNKKALNN